MSRSRKKEPVFKDPSNTEGKKFANRKLRRRVKQAIHMEDDTMPLLDEVMNQYDLIDFKVRKSGDTYHDTMK
jgi:hypothetical protein